MFARIVRKLSSLGERMSSTATRTSESAHRRIPDEGVVVVPSGAPQTDESPTVISKSSPLSGPPQSGNKASDIIRKQSSPESIVAAIRGRKLAHFELIDPIGVGGMAAVIRARDTQLDRIVALKILPPETSGEIENVQRFHQEAKAAAKLDHENIARVFFCGEDQGLHFIAFEFVEGVNLRAMLEKRGRIPVAESVRYILQIATGLEHAASRGVVHRDVKPSNIIITPDGRAKLVDMGLARNMERHGERDLTQSGMTLGTFDYISPEQALEPRDADARSDIYSLGCTFYHMLTGLPPVPEGTPAKKLHHHQHISPLDPRMVDPNIPDEIVMILGKMMDKNPDRRYQRPIHLVQHLIQIARKVGVGDDLPEGAMFVDTPLVQPPVARPMLLIGMAIASLVVVTLILSLAPQPDIHPSPDLTKDSGSKATALNPDVPKNNVKSAVLTPELKPSVVKTTAEFVAALADKGLRSVDVSLDGGPAIDLGNVTIHAGKHRLDIEAKDNAKNVLRLQAAVMNSRDGLTIESGDQIVFKRLRFELDAEESLNLGQILSAIAIRSPKLVRFEECVFTQSVPPISRQMPMASVHVDAGKNAAPEVVFKSCLFDYSANQDGGQVAVAVSGPAQLIFEQCAFKSCGAFVYIRGDAAKARTLVTLRNCSGLVTNGPVFRFEKDASAKLVVQKSVFSRATDAIGLGGLPQPGLIFVDSEAQFKFEGQQNIYHDLMAYVELNMVNLVREPEEFARHLAKGNLGFDIGSRNLKKNAGPWQEQNPLGRSDILAFQLKPEYADLGVKSAWTGQQIPNAAPPVVMANDPAKLKIVDPDTPGYSSTLNQALAAATDGDVIFIKEGENREVKVWPITLESKISVTLMPYEGHRPLLVLKKGVKDKDTAMFKVQDGSLRVVGMEVSLDPSVEGFESQSFVHLGETAICRFTNCVFNLRTTSDVKLNVVTFIDLDKMVKGGTPTTASARVSFDECLVRGRGDLVLLRGCRRLQVDVKNSLIALDGSLLDIESANKQMPMDEGVRWKMSKTSVFVTESLFAMRSKSAGKGLSESQVDADNCLLVSIASEQQPIVLLATERTINLEKLLKWRGDKNYFANFDPNSVSEWRTIYEPSMTAGTLTFPKLSDELVKTIWESTPDWFVQSESIANFGVPTPIITRLLGASP